MSAERIRELLGLMRENDVVELELEVPDFKVKLREARAVASAAPTAAAFYPPPPQLALPAPAAAGGPGAGTTPFIPPAAAAPVASAPAAAASDLVPIPSPIVGTFYRSSSPETDAFVAVGTRVGKDTVVCIIEAMKIMNEIKAGVSGTIEKLPVENGEPVEYGQPLFFVRPS